VIGASGVVATRGPAASLLRVFFQSGRLTLRGQLPQALSR
jgi:hypothetical protein